MSEVKTNKEYQAMLKEIEDLKKEIANHEDRALEVMESIDSLAKELKAMGKELTGRKKKKRGRAGGCAERNDSLKEQLGRLESNFFFFFFTLNH